MSSDEMTLPCACGLRARHHEQHTPFDVTHSAARFETNNATRSTGAVGEINKRRAVG
jgi:hypothetical protein